MNNRVAVLLSTFNGELFLEELLNSLLAQKDVDITIYIRDDGSTDTSKRILEEYKEDKRFIIEFSDNIGFVKSFWSLLTMANGFDYYAFCDQDDIWKENKLKNAIELLKKYDIPSLYTSNVELINENSESISGRAFDGRVLNRYESFQKSILPGCTFVFNQKARDLLVKYNGRMYSHDWAAYTIISSFGIVIYDNTQFPVKYRIHSNNTIGIENKLTYLCKRIHNFLRPSTNVRSIFAHDFYNTYADSIDDSEFKMLIYALGHYRESYKLRLYLLFNRHFKGCIFKMYVLLGRV